MTDVEFLAAARLSGRRVAGADGTNERATYARAETTLAVVVSPPSKRQLQPIPPSADRRVDLAEGCPAHCWFGEELERRLPAARPLYWT